MPAVYEHAGKVTIAQRDRPENSVAIRHGSGVIKLVCDYVLGNK